MSFPEEYMLPCLNKKIFGIDCFGCGSQRALGLLFQGEFGAAFKMYPAIYPLILLTIFIIFNLFIKFRHDEKLKIALFILSISVIIISYIIKLIN